MVVGEALVWLLQFVSLQFINKHIVSMFRTQLLCFCLRFKSIWLEYRTASGVIAAAQCLDFIRFNYLIRLLLWNVCGDLIVYS
jgi:hypothetical protein